MAATGTSFTEISIYITLHSLKQLEPPVHASESQNFSCVARERSVTHIRVDALTAPHTLGRAVHRCPASGNQLTAPSAASVVPGQQSLYSSATGQERPSKVAVSW